MVQWNLWACGLKTKGKAVVRACCKLTACCSVSWSQLCCSELLHGCKSIKSTSHGVGWMAACSYGKEMYGRFVWGWFLVRDLKYFIQYMKRNCLRHEQCTAGGVVEHSQGESRLGRNGERKFHIKTTGSTLVAQGITLWKCSRQKQSKVP